MYDLCNQPLATTQPDSALVAQVQVLPDIGPGTAEAIPVIRAFNIVMQAVLHPSSDAQTCGVAIRSCIDTRSANWVAAMTRYRVCRNQTTPTKEQLYLMLI